METKKNFMNDVWVKYPDGTVKQMHGKIILEEEEFEKLRALNPPHTYIVYIKPKTL